MPHVAMIERPLSGALRTFGDKVGTSVNRQYQSFPLVLDACRTMILVRWVRLPKGLYLCPGCIPFTLIGDRLHLLPVTFENAPDW